MGVDGLRLDAVPYLHEREGTNCENLPETHDVLKRLRKHMDAKYPDRMLLAEANQWPEDAAAYFGDGDECHMNFHFPVMPRLFMSLRLEHRTPIVDIMEQTPEPPAGGQWATFLRNHDELTLEMVTDEERDLMLRAYATDAEMRINLGIRRRLAPLLGNDRRKIELLNALLFSLPGTPVIYYGDEIGMGDNVYLGDRNGVRTPMQWSADRNAGFSSANPHRLYLPLITEQGYHYESVNVETQAANPASLLSWMRQLIALRKRHRVLGRGTIDFLEPDNHHVLAFVRCPTTVRWPPTSGRCCASPTCPAWPSRSSSTCASFGGATPVEVFGQNRFAPIGDGPYSLTLAPYGFFWFALEAERPAAAAPADGPAHLAGSWPDVLRRRARARPGDPALAPRPALVRRQGCGAARPDGRGRRRAVRRRVALAVVRTSFTEGDDHLYSVPLLHTTRGSRRGAGAPPARLAHRPARRRRHRRRHGAAGRGRRRRRCRAAPAQPARPDVRRPSGTPGGLGSPSWPTDPHDVHVVNAEQTNSSAIVGGRVIAKLIRRLTPGDNPDVTLPMHLRARGFDHVPGVAGTLDVQLGDDAPANAVVVHDVVTNEADLWEWSQDLLTREVERLVSEPDSTAGRRRDGCRHRPARPAHRRDAPGPRRRCAGLRAGAVLVAVATLDPAEPAGVAARDAAARPPQPHRR